MFVVQLKLSHSSGVFNITLNIKLTYVAADLNAVCLAHVHRLIVSLSQPEVYLLRSRIKISKFITRFQLFWTASDKQL